MIKKDDEIDNKYDGGRKARPGWPKYLIVLVLFISASYIVYLLCFLPLAEHKSDKRAVMDSISHHETMAREALAQGKYQEVWQEIQKNHLAELSAELQDQLEVTFYFKYDLPQAVPAVDDRLQLPINTRYWIVLHPSETCYIYLLQCNTAGEWQQLFPNTKYAEGENPSTSGEIYIPKYGRFLNETGQGTERLYLLATRWRQDYLENLILKAVQNADHEQPLLDYIELNLGAKLAHAGIVCKEFAFDHL
ncbi:MAG TPA: DUF4384 domain-containing protein [bacterium]|nr:DUF4384 domain-containing protein [bacterium]HPG45254.1 DUF4384 domain-containing protein [bacterium]HPM99027.1 DUF4384 domain-containing protein [bacterium]